MMTKKDYKKIAKIIALAQKQAIDGVKIDSVIDMLKSGFIALFEDDNPQFSADRFEKEIQRLINSNEV
ncbi:hypothetical protein M0R01_03580 [bacterium]|nr:hypothetical protein [bacterium]